MLRDEVPVHLVELGDVHLLLQAADFQKALLAFVKTKKTIAHLITILLY